MTAFDTVPVSSRPPALDGRQQAPRPSRRSPTPYRLLTPTVVLLVVLMAAPIVMVVGYSLMDRVITARQSEFVGFDNYAQVLQDPVFWVAAKNTAYFAGISVLAHMVIGMALALLLDSHLLGSRTKAVFRAVYVLPWLFTIAVTAVLWRMLLSPNGIVNYLITTVGLSDSAVEWLSDPSTALPAVTLINIWSGYPFFMVSLLAGLQGIPRDLYEAARVDGAGPVKQFRYVTIPQLRPILISMALLDLIWTSQQFALIWMTTGGGPITSTEMLSTYTYKLAFAEYDFSVASSAAVLVLLMSMVLAFFYVRHQRARD